VDDDGPANYTKIQYAVENASWGDTIIVRPGHYKERLTIEKSINLIGSGKDNTTIEGGNKWWSVVYISASNVTFSGFGVANSSWTGIDIEYADHVTIHNNSVKNCYYGIYMYFVDNNTITNNTLTYNSEAGIYTDYSTHNLFKYNNCSKNGNGITIYDGYKETVKFNTLFRNRFNGISLDYSNSITITNNSMVSCGISINGWDPSHWDSHIIDTSNMVNGRPVRYWKNKVIGKVPTGAGQVIIASCRNIVVESQNCSDGSTALTLGYSNKIKVRNNIFMNNYNNDWIGGAIYLYGCNNITIENNILNSNHFSAIYIEDSLWNTISNNTLTNNNYGIYQSWRSNYMNVSNNTITFTNQTGIYLSGSSRNIISQNKIANNTIGINLEWDCMRNTIFENSIENQLSTGIQITSWCLNNDIYHNNIINNPTQATDDPSNGNDWYKNSEGNYWDDYTGNDNDGDGIGDTSVPHPGTGFDRYPFMIPNGWLFPGQARLKKPEPVDNDGNYTISWNVNNRATGYILEEDVSETFDSPLELYNGTNSSYDFINKSEGTYYYRLKVFNDYHISDWSTPVNVTVDYLPIIPRNISVHAFPFGNALKIFWEPNVHDTTNYEIYYRTNDTQTWTLLANLSHPNGDFIHTDLIDGEWYHYKLRSLDARGQYSDFTKEYYSVPSDTVAPAAPTELEAEAVSDKEIYLEWTGNTDDDLAGYAVFMTVGSENVTLISPDDFELLTVLSIDKTSYTVTGLSEQVTYFFSILAFDEVPNNSSYSAIVSATTPDETHPKIPTGLNIFNATHNSLTLSWEASIDVDVVGYNIYISKSASSGYEIANSILVNHTNFVDTGLDESTIYYYKVTAVDDAALESLTSDFAFGKTLIGPRAPTINNSIDKVIMDEDTTDELAINLFYLFKDENNDPMTFWCNGQEHINVTFDQNSGMVILTPEKDWSGTEAVTFFASDSSPQFSPTPYTINITVNPINDLPGPAEIVEPKNRLEIKEGNKLDLIGACPDPDLPFGDVLTFIWTSNISGQLGEGQNLSDIKLDVGDHKITLEVKDHAGESSITSINVKVLKSSDSDRSDSGFVSSTYLLLGVLAVIILIVLALYLIILKKKTKETKDTDNGGDKVEAENKSQTMLPQQPIRSPQAIQQAQAMAQYQQFQLQLQQQQQQLAMGFTYQPTPDKIETKAKAAPLPIQSNITQKPLLPQNMK